MAKIAKKLKNLQEKMFRNKKKNLPSCRKWQKQNVQSLRTI